VFRRKPAARWPTVIALAAGIVFLPAAQVEFTLARLDVAAIIEIKR
jgi:hypothetical protein